MHLRISTNLSNPRSLNTCSTCVQYSYNGFQFFCKLTNRRYALSKYDFICAAKQYTNKVEFEGSLKIFTHNLVQGELGSDGNRC